MKRFQVKDLFLGYGFYLVLLAILVIFSITSPSFRTATNFIQLLHGLAPILIMIAGLPLVILTGAIDFSVGSIAFLSGQIGIYLMVLLGWPSAISLPLIVLAGALLGGINGLIIEKFKVNPLITTFGTMLIFRGFGYLVAGAKYIPIPKDIAGFHGTKIGPVYADTLIAILLVVGLYLIQKYTIFGKHLMAIGSNRENAMRLGVKTSRVSLYAFIISGLFAGLGSIFYMIQGGYMTPRMGQGLEFTGVAIAVIGGISLFGGEGSVLAIIFGIFTIYVIENGMQHLGLSPYIYPFLRGGIIFIAMYVDSLKNMVRHAKVIQI
jgi:ribose/xylose/arabinose/galactoside ABC-type transport system permease subunit